MTMHTIEKEILVESLYGKAFISYQASVIGGYMEKHNITIPRLQFECKGKGTAGYYQPKFRARNGDNFGAAITINLAYYNGGDITNLETTIAHELAHHITHCIWPHCKQWHGSEFRMVMNSIGYDGNTYHRMSVKVAKQVASKAKDELFEF